MKKTYLTHNNKLRLREYVYDNKVDKVVHMLNGRTIPIRGDNGYMELIQLAAIRGNRDILELLIEKMGPLKTPISGEYSIQKVLEFMEDYADEAKCGQIFKSSNEISDPFILCYRMLANLYMLKSVCRTQVDRKPLAVKVTPGK